MQRQHDGQARVDRAAERLEDRVVDDPVERLADVAGPVLADPVEHDDRVVDAEADDGQHGGHEQGVDLDVEERAEDGERRRSRRGRRGRSATRAAAPNRKSWNRIVIQTRIPTEPSEDEQRRLLDQLLADRPGRRSTASAGRRSARAPSWMPVATSPNLPVVGTPVPPPVPGDGLGTGAPEARRRGGRRRRAPRRTADAARRWRGRRPARAEAAGTGRRSRGRRSRRRRRRWRWRTRRDDDRAGGRTAAGRTPTRPARPTRSG